MTTEARILIATDSVGDAMAISKTFRGRYDTVSISTDPHKAAADFDAATPNAIVLAFDNIEKSERYYLGLFRTSAKIHQTRHRTIVFCANDRVDQAYRLCREKQFDEYVVYWPLTFDAQRVFMAIDHLINDIDRSCEEERMEGFRKQAQNLSEVAPLFDASFLENENRLAAIANSLETAKSDIGAALNGICDRVINGGLSGALDVIDDQSVKREFDRVHTECVQQRMKVMEGNLSEAQLSALKLCTAARPHLDNINALSAIAAKNVPTVLLVDDDAFQCKLMAQAIEQDGFGFRYANSGARALAMIQKEKPALVLMDICIPDIDGIRLTRKIKAMRGFLDLPIIMLTGNSEKQVVMESLNAGALDFIVKPIDKCVLLSKIRRAL